MFRDAVAAFAESMAEVFYDQVITIKQPPTGGIGGDGHPTGSWQIVAADIPCSFEDRGGSEASQAGRTTPVRNGLFRMAYVAGLDESMRVYWGDRLLEILNVANPNGMDVFTELLVSEIDGGTDE